MTGEAPESEAGFERAALADPAYLFADSLPSGKSPVVAAENLKRYGDSMVIYPTVGIPAPAPAPEFLVELIGEEYALDLVAAPYRGSAPMIGDMLGDQIPAGVGSVPDFIENLRAGKLRITAVMGDRRQTAQPDVPTFAELGLKGFEDVPYYGFFAPAGTPNPAIDRFSAALARVLAQPDVRDKLAGWGLTVQFMTSEQLAARERAYSKAWAEIIRRSGVRAQ